MSEAERKRGRKHIWGLIGGWTPGYRCARCKATTDDSETYCVPNGVGVRVVPVFGCAQPSPERNGND